jgi:radical SAM superfamily enzyme YgiQ (UPF0313 family)
MKVLLINPPMNNNPQLIFPPINLLLLAATVAHKKNIDVEIKDINLDVKKILLKSYHDVKKYIISMIMPYDVIGFTTLCNTYPITIDLADEIKKKDKNKIIILGGPQASVTASTTMKLFNSVDYICFGESEISFPTLLDSIYNKKILKNVPGIYYRENGEIRFNGYKYISDLSNLPIPLYDKINIKEYHNYLDDNGYPIEVARGCPFNCTFCSTSSFFSKKVRHPSLQRILKEINILKNKYKIHDFTFTHDHFTINKTFINNFCNILIDKKYDITWTCYARCDKLDKYMLEKMKKAGCRRKNYFIETITERILNLTRKHINLSTAKNIILETKHKNIEPKLSFVYGFPFETKKDLNQTLELILFFYCKGINYIQIHLLSPLSNTEITKEYYNSLVYTDHYKSNFSKSYENDQILKQLILQHPTLFSSFYLFKTSEFTSLEMYLIQECVTEILFNFPTTLELLKQFTSNSVLDITLDFFNKCAKLVELDDSDLVLLFRKYINENFYVFLDSCKNNAYFKYEFDLYCHQNTKETIQQKLFINTKLKSNIKIYEYDYDVTQNSNLNIDPNKIKIFFVNNKNQIKIYKINSFGSLFLEACNGKNSKSKIVDIIHNEIKPISKDEIKKCIEKATKTFSSLDKVKEVA